MTCIMSFKFSVGCHLELYDYLKPWLDISISRAIRMNTWKFAELTYTLGTMKLVKRKEQRLIFKLGTLAPNGINERFSFA